MTMLQFACLYFFALALLFRVRPEPDLMGGLSILFMLIGCGCGIALGFKSANDGDGKNN